MECLGFSLSSILSSVYNNNFTSYQFEYLLFFFSCLIAVIKNSNTVLKRSGECGYPCLVPHFSRKAFSLLSLSIILAVGLS